MERIHYLYKITNLINGKLYIGQTREPSKRWYDHKRKAANPKQAISFALKKYGVNNFDFELIACCKTKTDADLVEQELIKQYDCLVNNDKGYNIALGSISTPKNELTKKSLSEYWTNNLTGFHSPEARAKAAKTKTGRKASDEHRAAISKALKGKPKSEQAKQNMRGKKKPKSEKTRKYFSELFSGENNPFYGKKHTDETKAKISKANSKIK